ncbi:hypothetical protein [Flavobacterium croceum]|uniref:hypothetical protein n=1 Tax=Flavobacterium croceum TaxID=370975 RepID=UPI0024A8BC85|nr:hypothetical protein [Flavobacterium croceum]
MSVLLVGTLSFASTGKVVKPLKIKKNKAVACCTVGDQTACGQANEPLCDRARALYCAKHKCTTQIASIQ